MGTTEKIDGVIKQNVADALIIRGIIPLMVLVGGVFIAGVFSPGPTSGIMISALIFASLVMIRFVAKFKGTLFAAYLFIFLFMIFLSIGAVINGGVIAPAYITLIIPMSYFLILSSNTYQFIPTILFSFIGVVLVFIYEKGYMSIQKLHPMHIYWLVYTTIAVSITIYTVAYKKMLHKYLAENINGKELVEQIFESITQYIALIDAELTVYNANRTFTDFIVSLEQAHNKEFSELKFIDTAGKRNSLQDLVRGDTVQIENYKVKVAEIDEEIWLHLSLSPLSSYKESLFVLVIHNITELVEKDNRINQAEKMDSIGLLASGIAHDFNNMLGAISGASELAENSARDEQKEYFNIIKDSTKKAASLTNELLNFARKNPLSLRAVDMHLVINNVVYLLRRTIDKKIVINTNLHATSPIVLGDEAQLQNVILNLCINSSHAIDDSGEILITTQNNFLDTTYCEQSSFDLKEGTYLVVTVRDNGCGMSSELMKRIFEPFFSTKKEKGTGLGLASVYGLVKKFNGSIEVESEEGIGTTFTIMLPVTEDDQNKSIVREDSFVGSGKILIVDDEDSMRNVIAHLLTKFGYSVVSVSSGVDALKAIYNTEFDLIIVDMIMPIMSGKDLFYKLKEQNINIPVILSSGFSENSDIEEMKKDGLNALIKKPYLQEELFSVVNSVIKGNRDE